MSRVRTEKYKEESRRRQEIIQSSKNMVAISLYRGNLHRVPDVPRRWLMPTPKISLKDFKTLLNRRNRALSRLRSANVTLNPTPNSDSDSKQQPQPPKPTVPPIVEPKLEDNDNNNAGNGQTGEENLKNEEINDPGKSDGGDCSVKQVNEAEVVPENKATDAVVDDEKLQSLEVEEKPTEPVNPNVQTTEKLEVLDDKEKRKREIEEKLQTLNGKKHNLVQALKQILNAEEEIKRRNLMQGMVNRPGGQLQVDATSDPGLMTRHPTPRMGSEAHLGGDMEGAEAEDTSNQNTNSRHTLRMSSMSPSSESPLRRPAYFQHNMVPHTSRASLGATGSPSRFAPTGHQGNLPAVSVSGTNYIASSPSPAASGGTSVFRDARQPSPWN